MALGTNMITTTTAAGGSANGKAFVPDLWSDEIAVAYKKNLVIANLIARMDHTGKYGAVVHVPSPVRTSAATFYASQGVQITPTVSTEGEFTVTINQHWVNSKQIPDVAEKQFMASYRRFITDDLSYSLAKAVDNYLHVTLAPTFRGASALAGSVIGSDGSTAWSATANTNTGNGAALTDAGIRKVTQTLDDLDVPGSDRFWVIPPAEKNRLLGLSRFTEQAFVGEAGSANSMRTGKVGDLYGVPVYVSSNCAFVDDNAGTATVAASQGTGTHYRQAIYAHRDSAVLVEQIKPRVQAQYKVEYLSDVLVADTLFGAALVRTLSTSAGSPDVTLDRGISVIVPA